MRYFSAQAGATDESILFHLAEVMGQHLLPCLREESAQRRRAHSGLSAIPFAVLATLEGAESACHPGTSISTAQGMGMRWHLL
jgi:hypothetical protein